MIGGTGTSAAKLPSAATSTGSDVPIGSIVPNSFIGMTTPTITALGPAPSVVAVPVTRIVGSTGGPEPSMLIPLKSASTTWLGVGDVIEVERTAAEAVEERPAVAAVAIVTRASRCRRRGGRLRRDGCVRMRGG